MTHVCVKELQSDKIHQEEKWTGREKESERRNHEPRNS